MSDIKVNTSDLRSEALNLSNSANEFTNLKDQITNLISSTGNSYNNQLQNQIEQISSGIISTGLRLPQRAQELSEELTQRANLFENANEISSNIFTGITLQMDHLINSSPLLQALSLLSKSDISKANFLWGLGGLGFGGFLSLVAYIFQIRPVLENFNRNSLSTNTSVKTSRNFLGIATRVNEDNEVLNQKLAIYPRGSTALISSNCTWYAAAAVYEAYGIYLISYDRGNNNWFKFGDGEDWAQNAQEARNDPNNQYHEYIDDVNLLPSAGSVFSGPSGGSNGHVYFVENAELTNQNGENVWEVTASEENYYGTPIINDRTDGRISNTNPAIVQIPGHPEVKRWTKTIYYNVDEQGNAVTSGLFIHFRNPNN